MIEYICWNRFPNISGTENRSICAAGGPDVMITVLPKFSFRSFFMEQISASVRLQAYHRLLSIRRNLARGRNAGIWHHQAKRGRHSADNAGKGADAGTVSCASFPHNRLTVQTISAIIKPMILRKNPQLERRFFKWTATSFRISL